MHLDTLASLHDPVTTGAGDRALHVFCHTLSSWTGREQAAHVWGVCPRALRPTALGQPAM